MIAKDWCEMAKRKTDAGAVVVIDGETWLDVTWGKWKGMLSFSSKNSTMLVGFPDDDLEEFPSRVRFMIDAPE